MFPLAEVGRFQLQNGIAVSVNDILLVVVILVWLATHLIQKKQFSVGKLFKPMLIFACIGLLSLLLNFSNLGVNNLLISSLYLVRWIAYALIYVIVNEFEPKFKNKISYILLFSGSMVVLLGYLQYFFYPSLRNLYYLGWDEHLYRMFSSFLDPNFAGVFFVLFFVFSFTLALKHWQKRDTLKSLIIAFVVIADLIAVYLTYSRSAFIMLIAVVTTYLIIQKRKKLIVAAIIALVAIVFFLPKSFTTEGTNLLRAVSSEARVKTAQDALIIIQKSPIYGVGFNAYRYAGNKLGIVSGLDWQISHGGAGTDNSFLFVLATTGIIGFMAFMYLLYKLMRLGILNKQNNNYAPILVCSLVGLVIGSIFVNSLFYVFILEWVWILASLTEKS